MFKLIVKHKLKLLQEVNLQEDKEYSIGRGQDNDIVLPDQHGISRKHLVLSKGDDNTWVVRNLSQTSSLIVEDQTVEEAAIAPGSSFQIMDCEFFIEMPPTVSQSSFRNLVSEPPKEDAPSNASDPVEKEDPKPKKSGRDMQIISADEKTAVMNFDENDQNKLKVFLKVYNEDNGQKDVFTLEDQTEWIIGRDLECDIQVESDSISRKHFKIKKEGNQYFISDLKSANGTCVNDSELVPGKAYPLRSSDVISILDIEILFEIKNLSLEKELVSMKAPVVVPSVDSELDMPMTTQQQQVSYAMPPTPADMPGVIIEGVDDVSPIKKLYQKNRKRILIYGTVLLVAMVGGIYHFQQEAAKKRAAEETKLAKNKNPGGLSDKQMEIVKDTYQQARLLYAQGQFEYCKSEIKKIYQYIDSYEQSKKLEVACTQAAENRQRQFNIEEQKRKEKETDEFIGKIASECGEKFNTIEVRYELMSCLQPAIELSPADGRITSLVDRFDTNETLKLAEQERKKKRRQFIQSIIAKYNYAKSLNKKGKTLAAMAAYEKFIKISNHKELTTKRKQAVRELAGIRKSFNSRINTFIRGCEMKYEQKQWKEAYYACESVSKVIPPSRNKPALAIMKKALERLEIQMKPLYEEAAINESMGNVAVAKDYWNKILLKDVKDGVYYIRSKVKLDNY